MTVYYIGLSASGHDPALAVVGPDGRVVFAESTERFLQDKRAWGISPDHFGHLSPVVQEIINNDPKAEFRIATTWKSIKADLPVNISDVLLPAHIGEWIRSLQAQVRRNLGIHCRFVCNGRIAGDVMSFDHHLCHAANAVYSSPFQDGLCLVLDGEGEVGSASLFSLTNGKLKRIWRSWGPGSMGTFYTWLTQLCGFSPVSGEEWKVMGLAAFGKPEDDLVEQMSRLFNIKEGRILLADPEVLQEVNNAMQPLTRQPDAPIMQSANLAASGQLAYGKYVDQILSDITDSGVDNLILTGGCALNSSYNGSILSHHSFKQLHIPSAPADDGNALGAALLAWSQENEGQPFPCKQTDPFLGSKINLNHLAALQAHTGLRCTTLATDDTDLIAELLAQGIILGVMRGRAEFGPRALGNRSILADPRIEGMKDRVNKIVKGREGYRPFAPIILQECVEEWFENPQPSPYMSFTLKWKKEKQPLVPAVVHADGTGRLQTVDHSTFPWLYDLVKSFKELTNIPVLLNTSFNVMGKPIVHSVHDALSVLMSTGLDAILIETTLIEKSPKK